MTINMMIMIRITLGLILVLNFSVASACINTYVFELGRDGLTQDQAKEELLKKRKPFKSYQELNDYAVLLIYAHRYNEAIQILKSIEQKHPNLAKTAANLGTAYELNGDFSKAKYWITQGMKRDPNIHEGSEWIHLKILDAQVEQKKDKNWIKRNDVLGLDFGRGLEPVAKIKQVKYENQTYDLETVLAHSEIQMDQRLRFVYKDPITAQIIFNMGNIEAYLLQSDLKTTTSLYHFADMTGYVEPQFLRKRVHYLDTSKWYNFKRKIVSIFRQIKNLII